MLYPDILPSIRLTARPSRCGGLRRVATSSDEGLRFVSTDSDAPLGGGGSATWAETGRAADGSFEGGCPYPSVMAGESNQLTADAVRQRMRGARSVNHRAGAAPGLLPVGQPVIAAQAWPSPPWCAGGWAVRNMQRRDSRMSLHSPGQILTGYSPCQEGASIPPPSRRGERVACEMTSRSAAGDGFGSMPPLTSTT